MLAFNELMRRVRPQQEVTEIRDEVKVRKIERLSGKAAGVSDNQICIQGIRLRLCVILGEENSIGSVVFVSNEEKIRGTFAGCKGSSCYTEATI